MYKEAKHSRNVGLLCALIVLSALLIAALRILPLPPEHRLLIGGLTVFFGLFVGSRPAANMIDIFMFDRYMLRRKSTRLSDLAWVGLNLLTVAVAWLIIVEGTTRFLTASH